MSYLEKVTDLYAMIGTGKVMDAFEKYYHEDVVMQELGEAPHRGKAVNREREIAFFSSIKEFHGSGVDAITANEAEKVTAVENWMEVTFQNDVRVRVEQVAVQRWEGDLIVSEKFYHK